MSNRVENGAAANGVTTAGAGLSGAALGIILTYTCPANRQAKVVGATLGNFTGGAPTITYQFTVGGVTIKTVSGSIAQNIAFAVYLNAGDHFDLNVTTLAAGSTVDCSISAEEFLAA